MVTRITRSAVRRFAEFIHAESSSGLVILAATALALLAANSIFAPHYRAFIDFSISLGIGPFVMAESLGHWVKDVLMVLFFLVVGMELKREMCEGVLVDKRQILLPLVAALGGMLAPALVFLAINAATPENAAGWAIPTATDIAFALAVLLMAARHVPPALKIFLLAIAIFDDLGAILIITFFYSDGVTLLPLLAAAWVCAVLLLCNRLSVMVVWPYIMLGVLLCVALEHSGIHATIGGVIVGLAIPMRDKQHPERSPLNGLMHRLHPWVSFGILPLFAFTAAGVSFADIPLETMTAPLTMGIVLGLFLGKQLGIFGASWLLIRAGFARRPEGTSWAHLYAVSLIAGIGFTMSLFVGSLAFADEALQLQVKLGVLAGSLLSAAVGWLALRRSCTA